MAANTPARVIRPKLFRTDGGSLADTTARTDDEAQLQLAASSDGTTRPNYTVGESENTEPVVERPNTLMFMSRRPVKMPGYAPFVRELKLLKTASPFAGITPEIAAVLDGRAAADLRRLIPVRSRRAIGAFFTPEHLANRLTEPLADLRGRCVVVDPACGAGDLLLAAAYRLQKSTKLISPRLIGIDIVPEFVSASELRIDLLLRSTGKRGQAMLRQRELMCGDGRTSEALARATHIVVNPPFTMTAAPAGCKWSSGSVNSAAPFLLDCISRAAPGTRIRAILPDVLRSGTRYRRWREQVSAAGDIRSIERLGRFDQWTDVDVFLLDLVVALETRQRMRWAVSAAKRRVADHFTVGVGPVVHFRDPLRGPWRPYLTSKSFPTWKTIRRVAPNRRFKGRVIDAPFVVIPRTSRPSEPHRARGAVVLDERAVAVDNHLIVLSPHDGKLSTCDRLLAVLQSASTSTFLNDRIRCRHLTVDAVAAIPWSES